MIMKAMHDPAAIYTRISRDRAGQSLGVERQEEACRALAAQRGYEVVAVHVDNDLSAYSGKPRPGYDDLLRLMATGRVRVVLVLHTDRLHRSPTELEDFITLCEKHNVRVETVHAGPLDLSTATGRMGARIYGAVARHEVEHAIERIKAAKLQHARAGKFSGGQRPWGYEPGCTAIREDEAAVYRELVARVIRGESFRSCALDLNARGIRTTNGKAWNGLKVRNLLSHKRYAGIREHHDAEYEATWPAVISRETFAQLERAIELHAAQYKQRGPARKYLLTGFAYCGRCGNRMNTAPNSYGKARYVCRRFSDEHGEVGCGRLTRLIAPVDYLVTESVIYRLDSANLAKLLQDGRPDDGQLHEAIQDVEQRKQHVHDLADRLGNEPLSTDIVMRALSAAQDALRAAESRLEALTRARAGANIIPAGETVRAAWERSDLQWRRQLLGLLVEKVVIHPSNIHGMTKAQRWQGKWVFRPEHVEIVWRV